MTYFVPQSILDGRKVVASAGTAVPLSTTGTSIYKVTVQAETDNTGGIVVGGSTVVAALSTRRGIYLAPGDTQTFHVSDLADVWIDATVTTDGVTFNAEVPSA